MQIKITMQSLKREITYKDGIPTLDGEVFIGWIYNEGPPHDHNHIWVDSRYLEELHPDFVSRGINEVWIVFENGSPLLYKEKLIMDLDKLLP